MQMNVVRSLLRAAVPKYHLDHGYVWLSEQISFDTDTILLFNLTLAE